MCTPPVVFSGAPLCIIVLRRRKGKKNKRKKKTATTHGSSMRCKAIKGRSFGIELRKVISRELTRERGGRDRGEGKRKRKHFEASGGKKSSQD